MMMMMESTSFIKEQREIDKFSSSSFENDNLSTLGKIRSSEMKDRLARADLKIKKLERDICQANEQNKNLLKHVDGKVKTQNEIIEKQNESLKLMSFIEGQTNVLTDTLKRFNDSREDLTKLYEKLNSKEEELKLLNERFKDRINEMKIMKEQLLLKNNHLLTLQIQRQRFENDITERNRLVFEAINKRENIDTLMKKEEENYVEEITRLSTSTKNIEESLKSERDKKSKLLTESNENSKMIKDLLSKLESSQVTTTEYEKRVKDLKSDVLISSERVTNLNNDMEKLELKNVEIISKKDFELSVYRKRLKDLTSMHREAVDKLSQIISENENLSERKIKTFDDIERLKNNLKTKDDELIKINTEITKTLEKSKQLSIEIQTLDEELITKEKQISQLNDHLKIHEATKEEYVKEEGEVNMELSMIEIKLNNKTEDISKLLADEREEKIKSDRRMNNLKSDIEEKTKEIIALERTAENHKRELEYDEARYSSEIQHAIYLSKECKMFEHEKKIKQNNGKIDILNKELSYIKQQFEEIDKKEKETAENDRKELEKYQFELNELKLKYNELNDEISSIEKANETLDNKLKNIQTYNDENFNQDIEMLRKSSSLMRITYQENEPSPTKSHPKPILKSNIIDSPFKVQRVRFDFASEFNLVDNINGLEMMEEAERRYIDSTVSNRPADRSNLQIPTTAVELEKSPVTDTPRRTSSRKFFKRTKPENKDTVRSSEGLKDPYSFK